MIGASGGVQPPQDPGDTLRMNSVGEREETRETSLDRAKSVRGREREGESPDLGVQQSLAASGSPLFFTIAFIP